MDDTGKDKLRPVDEPEPLSDLANCLQATFTADNHHSLSDEVTHSLLHLSREEKTASMLARLHPAREPTRAKHGIFDLAKIAPSDMTDMEPVEFDRLWPA